jgi:hypothetical protein
MDKTPNCKTDIQLAGQEIPCLFMKSETSLPLCGPYSEPDDFNIWNERYLSCTNMHTGTFKIQIKA